MTTLILAASPSQANWDQANAFEEGQQRVAIGKDPMPGPRSCFWRYGPVSGDPYINIAFPDAGTFYWGAAFSVPKGAKLHLEGSFPHARYMSLISYDRLGAPLDSVADYLIAPKPGASNPYLFGADRNSKQRGYKIAQRAVQSQAQDRESQGPGACQGRASVPGDQAPVRLCEDTLPRSGEEHGTAGDTVRAVEPVDGAPTFADECGRGASVMWEMTAARLSRRPETLK